MPPQIALLAKSPDSTCQKHETSTLLIIVVAMLVVAIGTGCGTSSGAKLPSTEQLQVSIPLAIAELGVAYNTVASVSGGEAPYSFAVVRGTLPPGTALNSRTGAISGVPRVTGYYGFLLEVSDSSKKSNTGNVHIVVATKLNRGSEPRIIIFPSSTTVASKNVEQFTANVIGTWKTGVVWSATAGSISSTGQFTAPSVTSETKVTVTASSASRNNLQATATVIVTPSSALTITTHSVADASAGTRYEEALSASGGISPYKWTVSSGMLPVGLQLSSAGAIAGTTESSGSFPFTAKVTDSSGSFTLRTLKLTVTATSPSGYDGPAELPRVLIPTAMSTTPAPGNTITVGTGENLQAALNNAVCGDTVQLQPGSTFTGVFTFPAKSCDDNHWIIVRSGAEDSALPAEGSRLTPCYAGVTSLPARPTYACPSSNNVLAKLVMPLVGSGPVVFASGANHYRLVGLELTRTANTGAVTALAAVVKGGTANNLILDRMWLHGTAQDETTRGVQLGGTRYFSVIDSFFTDFHCVAVTGACLDSQSISGGTGDHPMGPYKISGNFLEAAGENVLFGGGEATQVPSDIEISHNHMFKPLTWLRGQPGYVGGRDGHPFIVKNLFEVKNGVRILLDSNVMEYAWGGFSQVGPGIVLTPKNQGGMCSICQVTDVTIRYGMIRHTAAGMLIGNGPSDSGAIPMDGGRYSIHDIIFDDIDGTKYNGPDLFVQLSTGPGAPALHDVKIDHVTALPKSTSMLIGNVPSVNGQMKNLVVTNNILGAGTSPVWSTGTAGTANCAVHNSPLTTLNACFSTYSFAGNVIVSAPSRYPPSTWPAENHFASSASMIGFVNYSTGNYLLQTASPYLSVGTNGKNPGADVNAINAALAGSW
jgi:hypothetical protein